MSDRIIHDRDRLNLRDDTSTPTIRAAPSPVILVPATPPTTHQVQQATQRAASPTLLQRSPRSYAQVVALSTATTANTVQPFNTPLAAAGTEMQAPAQVAGVANATAAAPAQVDAAVAVMQAPHAALQAEDIATMPRTPILRPTRTGLANINARIRLPPPALPLTGGLHAVSTILLHAYHTTLMRLVQESLNTPVLRPVSDDLDDIDAPLALPPPAVPWMGAHYMV